MTNEMKKSLYEAPAVNIAELDSTDVITTSGGSGSNNGNGSWNNNYIDPSGWT